MKKLLFFTTVLLFAGKTFSKAQSTAASKPGIAEFTSLGPVVGAGNSWVGNMGGKSQFMTSGNVGIDLVYARSEHWGWGGMLCLSSQGYKVDYNGYTAMAAPLYLRMPLRAYYFFNSYKDVVRPAFRTPDLGKNSNFLNSFQNACWTIVLLN